MSKKKDRKIRLTAASEFAALYAQEFAALYAQENAALTERIGVLEGANKALREMCDVLDETVRKLEADNMRLTAALIELTAPSQFITLAGHTINRHDIAYTRAIPSMAGIPATLHIAVKCHDPLTPDGGCQLVLKFEAGTPEYDAVSDWLYAQSDDLMLMRKQPEPCERCSDEPAL